MKSVGKAGGPSALVYYGADVVNTNTAFVVVNVGTTAVAAQAATTNLKGRKYLYIYVEQGTVAWGFDSAIGQSNWQNKATGVFDAGAQEVIPLGFNLTPYLVNTSASVKSRVHITELS